jgi:hypothetical protein
MTVRGQFGEDPQFLAQGSVEDRRAIGAHSALTLLLSALRVSLSTNSDCCAKFQVGSFVRFAATRGEATRLQLYTLSQLKIIVHLTAQVTNGTVDLGMTKQQLNRPQIACLSIDQRCVGPAQ